MSRLYRIALATIIGLSSPVLAAELIPTPAAASQANRLQGVFGDSKWVVSIAFDRNAYRYSATKIGDRNGGIDLAGASVTGTRDRRVYTWNNAGTRYQAVWQPKDPNFIRVRVFSPSGKEIFNRLLERQEDCC
jgi:hypothetical protein